MQVSQYAYFGLFSRGISAAEMAAVLGIEPDEITVRGSRRTEPKVVPVRHCWRVVCREPGLSVDEQVAHIVERLGPHTAAIAALVGRLGAEEDGGGAVLEVVRYFNEDGRGDTSNLFGWHLGRAVLDFLQATGAVLDVDEYDMTPD
ncbi:DUF4279 domain-containing protein [Actinoplanes sp. L3-i22]|uniref:DUF4279 domain-containing protein n=1 Tax=Actinoplanes sp. L3-i22 TaxID=2836373 RepID=UPI001C79835D|nr:DUF4279 domain-containing protein [Actinoplanes sp. L3-i22]BCY11675.1 hypothetical protein L3i22_067630 [Actinoplanes sp. L3-i22]